VSVLATDRRCRRDVLRLLGRTAVGLGVLATVPAMAADDPGQLIQTVANEVIELVKTKTGAEREAGLQKVLEAYFDMPFMGRSALATHWEKTSPDERRRYLHAEINAEAHAYSDRFGQYGGQTLDVGKVITRAGGVYVVQSRLNQKEGEPVKIDWEVRNTGEGLRITDVKIEGVSMVMTRRSDFNSYINEHGGQVEALIRELESRSSR